MLLGKFVGTKTNCPACKSYYGVNNSLEWKAQLSNFKWAKYLEILDDFNQLDFEAADEDQENCAKNDVWLDNQEHRVNDFKKYIAKKQN